MAVSENSKRVDYTQLHHFPAHVPIFPLSGALLLPRGQMPLNIFEPRYLAMIDAALTGDRLIGMIQPAFHGSADEVAIGATATAIGTATATGIGATTEAEPVPDLCAHGCLGKLVSWSETDDGRYLITLQGLIRFSVLSEITSLTPYRQAKVNVSPFAGDLDGSTEERAVDRAELLTTFRHFLEANDMEADWDSINRASTESLVNALSMMSPYGPKEKQALLEAPDLKTRAETLIALTEIELARTLSSQSSPLQ